MNSDLYQQILQDHKELSSLPQTLAEVLRVVRDEKTSATDLANVISHDPALTTKVLRVVNSPFYGTSREIRTMTQAVMVLGQRAVSALALSTSIYDVTGQWENSIDRMRFWRHSLEVGIACRAIAEAIKYECPEEAFITGLIHDIGLLVMEQSFPDKFTRIWQRVEAGENIFELEEQVWNTNHARLGRFLLEQWNLPEGICEAVGHYHNQFSPGTDQPEFCLSQIVALAGQISKFSLVKARPTLDQDKEYSKILSCNLKLDPVRLGEIEQSLFSNTVEEARFLEIDIGAPEDLLTEANRLLYEQYATVENLLGENNRLQDQIAKDKLKKAALASLKTITATFNHYVNNAAATILGRAQLAELAIDNGEVQDPRGIMRSSMKVIINGVNTISAVMDELKKLSSFDTIVYHDDTYVIDIEARIQEQLKRIDRMQAELDKSTSATNTVHQSSLR